MKRALSLSLDEMTKNTIMITKNGLFGGLKVKEKQIDDFIIWCAL